MKPYSSITAKLTLLFVLFAALLLVGVGFLAYNSGRAALEAATISDLLSAATEKEAALSAWVEDRQLDIAALTRSPDLLEDVATLVNAPPESTEAEIAHERLVAELQAWTGPGQQYLTLLVIEAETGRVIAATDPVEEGKFKENRPYFSNGKNDPYVQDIYYSLVLQKPAMTAAAPLRTAEGRLLGVLAGRLNLEELNAIINRRSGLHETDDAFLVNTSNLFVTQPRFITDPAILRQGSHSEAIRRCLNRANGVVSAEDYREVPVITVYRWLAERKLCLVVKLDQAEALAPAHAFGRTILLIGGLALLTALVLAIGLARTITRPVLALQAGAVRLGRGELEARLPETSGDELGRLAREFNAMAAALAEKESQLRRHAEELEQMVAERTASLQVSEERTRSIIESALDAVVTIDPESTIIGWNAQAETIFGWSREEALGQALDIILPPQYREAHHRGMQHFLATGEGPVLNRRFEITALRRDETEFPVELTISPVQSSDSVIFSAFIRDITERKRAEEQFRLTVEASPSAMILADTAGKISLVNAQAEVLFGYGREELLGQPVEMLVPPQFRSNHNDYRDGFFRAPTARPMGAGRDLFGLRKDGSQVPIEIGLNPITTTEGSFVLASIIDITERKRAEEQFRLAVEASPSAIIMVSTAGKISLVNAQAETLFSYAREEMLGQPVEMLVPSQFRDHHNDYRDAFLSAPTTRPMGAGRDLFGLRKDGSQVPIEIGLNPITTTEGSFVLASIIDITERKRAEQALRESEEKFRVAIKNSYFIPARFDRDLRYQWIYNPHPDFDPAQVIGQRDDELEDSEGAKQLVALKQTVIDSGVGVREEISFQRGDGPHTYDFSIEPLYDTAGHIIGGTSAAFDVTKQKLAEVALRESQARLTFLAEASNTLASSLDYHATLAVVAQLAVPRLADWCAVDVLEPDGSLRRVAVVHTDPAKVELAYELQRRYPPDPEAPRGVYHVLRTGQPDFYPEMSEAMLEAAGLKQEQLGLIRELGLKSAIVVPILVRDQALGAITFVAAESNRHYTEADLTLTQELAGRAALAVDNARLYQEAKELNEELEARVKERTAQLEATNVELTREITERKRVEEALRQHRQELRDYLDSMSTMTAKVGLDGAILLVNKIALQASGLSIEALMQTNFLEGQWWTFDPEVQARVRRAFDKAKAGTPVSYDEQIFVFGQVMTISFSLVPITGPDGQVAYIVAEGRDITPLKQAEKVLKEYSTQLEATNKELEAFAYSVSHDLRAPLRSIDGFSQALLEDYGDDLETEAQHYLQRVRAGSQRMAQLIDDLLALSRLTRSEMRRETIDLSALAHTIAVELRQTEPARQVEFIIAPNLTVQADARLIRVALENLLGNAWKFTAKRSTARIEFGVLSQADGGQLTYFVRDNGAGFDMTYADKLFGAFQRLHTPAEFTGTGIGLATVQRIIHRHGGQVWAEGVVEQGATFYFTLDSFGVRELRSREQVVRSME